MSILAVGSVAFDNIATPSGKRENVLGGSVTHFAMSASFFTDVCVVGVVGEDFKPEHEDVLRKRGIDTRGIEHVKGKTFRWGGQYLENLNEAKTDFTELNVFEHFKPRIPAEYRDLQFLFLANIHPSLQATVRREMKDVRLTGGDTMNFWIQGARSELHETLKLVNILLINDGEAKMLAGEPIFRVPRRKCWLWGLRLWSSSTENMAPPSSSAKEPSELAGILFALLRCRSRK